MVAHGYSGLQQDLLIPIVREEVPRLLAGIEDERESKICPRCVMQSPV